MASLATRAIHVISEKSLQIRIVDVVKSPIFAVRGAAERLHANGHVPVVCEGVYETGCEEAAGIVKVKD